MILYIKFYNSLNHVILDNISILSFENDGIIKPNIFEFSEFKKLGDKELMVNKYELNELKYYFNYLELQ